MAGEDNRAPTGQQGDPRQQIQAYGGGGFRISGRRRQGSVLIFAEHADAWAANSIETISAASLVPLTRESDGTSDGASGRAGAGILVIIGCGEKFIPMPAALRAELAAAGIHAEWMDTGAACRTFNVLAGEGRAVRAALLAVD